MRQPGPLGAQRSWRLQTNFSPPFDLRNIPHHLNALMGQERRFLAFRFLGIAAACLAIAFVASIMIEAFDADLDLWPDGAGDFTLAAADSLGPGSQSAGARAVLNAIPCFVISAGAHLVLRHRARSALATDRPSIFPSFSMAEPREPIASAFPTLGHFFFWGPSDEWNVRTRTRPTHPVAFSDALHLRSRSSL